MAEKAAYTLDTVAQEVRSWKAQGLKVVFTNGVFDVLHVGHVEVLEVACGTVSARGPLFSLSSARTQRVWSPSAASAPSP